MVLGSFLFKELLICELMLKEPSPCYLLVLWYFFQVKNNGKIQVGSEQINRQIYKTYKTYFLV